MKIKLMTMCAVMAMLMIAAAAQATPIQISVTGTADVSAMGYTSGESYTFNWVINDGYTSGSGDDHFDGGSNEWCAEDTSDPILWSSVSGDGITGTYSRPGSETWAPYDYISISDNTFLVLGAENDDVTGSSLFLTANGYTVAGIVARINVVGVDFALTGEYTNPADYFAEYIGTYTCSNNMYIYDRNYSGINFTPTSVTIAAVPEPATLGLVVLVGAGLIGIRRIFTI